MQMALGSDDSIQDLDERRHTYMVVVSPHCEHTEQVDTQADGDQEQLVRVHLREVQPVQMVSIAESAIEERHPQLLKCFKDDKYGDKNRR